MGDTTVSEVRGQLFRKKPVVIEAVRFSSAVDGSVICSWCGGSNEIAPTQIQIKTLEGTMTADVGDWVIKGVKGEFYPCKPDIFVATYEPVSDPDDTQAAAGFPAHD